MYCLPGKAGKDFGKQTAVAASSITESEGGMLVEESSAHTDTEALLLARSMAKAWIPCVKLSFCSPSRRLKASAAL